MLIGSTALVTGAAQGMGEGIARALAEAGARVVLVDRDDGVDAASERLTTSGSDVHPVVGDATRADDVARAFDEAERRFGPVDILVNNVGGGHLSLIADTSEEEWDAVISANLRSTFLGIREYARRHRPPRAGAIVNVSSVNATAPTDGMASMCAGKAAVGQLTRVAAIELAPHVTVNAVEPGLVLTPASEGPFTNGAIGQQFLERTPMGRFGETQDVGRAVVLLCSEEAAWITGATVPVDGGMHLRGVPSYWALATGGAPA